MKEKLIQENYLLYEEMILYKNRCGELEKENKRLIGEIERLKDSCRIMEAQILPLPKRKYGPVGFKLREADI